MLHKLLFRRYRHLRTVNVIIHVAATTAVARSIQYIFLTGLYWIQCGQKESTARIDGT